MKVRIVTAAIAMAIVLACVGAPSPWPVFALAGIAVIQGSLELGTLRPDLRHAVPFLGMGCVALLGAYLYGAFPDWTPSDFMVRNAGLLAAGYLGAAMLLGSYAGGLAIEAASLWIAAPLTCAVLIKASLPMEAHWSIKSPLLMLLIPIWAGDTMGLFVGKTFGTHKLWPSLSPHKTIEGAAANLVACVASAYGTGALIGLPTTLSIICGAACGVLGQAGDLFESALKRAAGKKDSGGILPGHGGVLDRLDSMLFSAPAVAALLIYALPENLR